MSHDDIVAVLVVPAERDWSGLIAWHQELGGGPPTAVFAGGGWIGSYTALRGNAAAQWAGDELLELVEAPHALVLWWHGALMPDGWDRARRVLYALATPAAVAAVRAGPGTNPHLSFVAQVGDLLVGAGLASRVVLLARAEIGRLVEVTP